MKVRTGRSRNVMLEMEPKDSAFPPIPLPELRLQRILLPVDFSECSRKALQYAVSFARQFHAEVVLLHVVEVVPVEGHTVAVEIREEAARQLSEWRKEIVSRATVKAVVTEAHSAHEAIVEAARESNVDMIVLGTHGRTGLAHLVLGSTAERVVRHAPCPVLVVRAREHEFLQSDSER